MLKQRIITALILIPITLLVLFYLPVNAFCLLIAFITLAGAWEWSNLMEIKKTSWRWCYLVIIAASLLGAFFISISYILISAFIWWLFATLLIFLYPTASKWWSKSIFWRGLMGVFVLTPCWTAINYIRIQPNGIFTLLFLFILIWGADSAAYFTGKKWGKTKLAAKVSPGKTLQGLYGAVIFSMLMAAIVLWISHLPLPQWPWILALSLTTILFSVVGDLFESMLKRNAELKDSGHLLPGHGGLLDRIDSLTAAAPIFALGGLALSYM